MSRRRARMTRRYCAQRSSLFVTKLSSCSTLHVTRMPGLYTKFTRLVGESPAARYLGGMTEYERFYREAYDPAAGLGYDLGAEGDAARYTELAATTRRWLERTGIAERHEARVLELGCGLGQLANVHPGWMGLEFSETAVARARESHPGMPIVRGDMQAVQMPDGSVDALFSWAAIEHVPRPELVLAEVERLLVPGGVAILAPAWNCRSWTVKRLQVRAYRDLSPREALEKLTIPVRDSVAWRAALALPKRVVRELRGSVLRQRVPFDYRRLHPDFSLDVPHITDDDAQASMDAHAALVYFASRGWDVLSHPGFLARMKARAEAVVVRKPT
jgi:SAM-dependent methyltransferase